MKLRSLQQATSARFVITVSFSINDAALFSLFQRITQVETLCTHLSPEVCPAVGNRRYHPNSSAERATNCRWPGKTATPELPALSRDSVRVAWLSYAWLSYEGFTNHFLVFLPPSPHPLVGPNKRGNIVRNILLLSALVMKRHRVFG